MSQRILSGLGMVAALFALGCSSSTGSSDTPACSVTLGGAISGTHACIFPAAAAWTPGSNQWTLSMTISGTQSVGVSVGSTGEPQKKTYLSTASDATGGLTVTSGNTTWYAIGSNGSYTVVLTSVNQLSSAVNGKTYTVHGTIDGTLISGGTAANVTIHGTF